MTSKELPRTKTHYNAIKRHFKIPKTKKEDTKKEETITEHKELLRKSTQHNSITNIPAKSKKDILKQSSAASPSELAFKLAFKRPIRGIEVPKMTCAKKTLSGKYKYDTRQLVKKKSANNPTNEVIRCPKKTFFG